MVAQLHLPAAIRPHGLTILPLTFLSAKSCGAVFVIVLSCFSEMNGWGYLNKER